MIESYYLDFGKFQGYTNEWKYSLEIWDEDSLDSMGFDILFSKRLMIFLMFYALGKLFIFDIRSVVDPIAPTNNFTSPWLTKTVFRLLI